MYNYIYGTLSKEYITHAMRHHRLQKQARSPRLAARGKKVAQGVLYAP
jgi:hypothetical protein